MLFPDKVFAMFQSRFLFVFDVGLLWAGMERTRQQLQLGKWQKLGYV